MDIQIEYVRMRQGEKLEGELSSLAEERTPTVNPLISRLIRTCHASAEEAARIAAAPEYTVASWHSR